MRLLAKTVILIILAAAVPAFAQTEPPARVGRVSLISGTLAFFGPGDSDWSAGRVNLPISAGAWLATDPQSRAEIRVGADSIDLAHDTQLDVADLRDKLIQLALTQGRIDLHLRHLDKGETAEIGIPRGGVWLLQPGVYDVDSGGPDQPTRITVFEGSARFVGGGVDTTVNAGDALVLAGADTLSATVERAAPDEFVRWCRSQDYHEQRLAAPYRVSPEMTGYEELDAYGEWGQAPDYGAVWYPKSLPADWTPYRDGRWVWIEPWGWNWVDDEPWGFAPFHYGRWARIEDRWGWVPGEFVEEPVYAPALVAFIPPPTIESAVPVPADAGPPVGWFPLAPGEAYWPSYTRDQTYIRNVNITNVSVTNLTTIMATRPASADPPPQVLNQQFANRAAATIVPARAFAGSEPIAKAAIAVAPQALRRAQVMVQPPPVVARPAAAAAPSSAATQRFGRAAPASQPGQTTAAQQPPTASAPPHPPARPNFSALASAPRVAHAGVAVPPSIASAPAAEANPPASGRASAPPSAETQIVPPAATPPHPPGPPDFAHLPPARIGPHGVPRPEQQPAQAGPAAAQPERAITAAPRASAPATVSPPSGPHGVPRPEQQPAQAGPAAAQPERAITAAPRASAPATVSPPSGPQSPPDFTHLGGPQGVPQPGRGASSPTPETHAAQQRAAEAAAQQRNAAEAAAREQAQQRAAGQAQARQQAQQRAAAEAAARQQEAQQRAAAQQAQQRASADIARQQAQQRSAAQAEARQQAAQQAQQRAAAETAARQQAQQRAAAEAVAHQQAAATQQRAAAEAAARQQVQQRAAAEAAARQQVQQAVQQRAAAQAAAAQQQAQQRAASQQAQQRAAAQAAAHQHQAEACGHPGQPACPH